MSKISQRDAFWNGVFEIAKKDKDVVVVTADMGAPAIDQFRTDLASQFVNVGIAEQNAITVAAGMAMNGKKVYTYAIAPFITLRCLEQIRVECSMMKVPITVVGVGAGFGYEDSGPTHHLTEDITVMRSMPEVSIRSVTDSVMAGSLADITYRSGVTDYVRLERGSYPEIYAPDEDFTKGLSVLKEGTDLVIVSTGSMTHAALEVAEALGEKGLDVGVIDLYTVPVNTGEFLSAIGEAKKVVTLEEHFLPGGLGSAVCEVLCDNGVMVPVKRLGLGVDKGYCYKYGGRQTIRGYYGVDTENVIKEVEEFSARGLLDRAGA